MRDADEFPEEPNEDCVVLAGTGEAFWLLEGDRYLNAILADNAPYPTPVQSVVFASTIELDAFLQTQDVQLASLWSIHPAVVDRLKSNNQLVAVNPPNAA